MFKDQLRILVKKVTIISAYKESIIITVIIVIIKNYGYFINRNTYLLFEEKKLSRSWIIGFFKTLLIKTQLKIANDQTKLLQSTSSSVRLNAIFGSILEIYITDDDR